jgi:hypothetical protein
VRKISADVYYGNDSAGDFFKIDDVDKEQEQLLISPSEEKPEPVSYIQFKIDESEFRRFERDRKNKFRRPKILKLSQRW